jgi:sulfite reductase (NADPH) flavoprotein alpha-component
VQDKISDDAQNVRYMIEKGAQILVCGGHDMAAGVKQVVNDIVLPLGIDVDQLILKGRYLEDVY